MALPEDGSAVDECQTRSSTSAAHLLVIPYPARGHNLASIQLARKFLPYGVRVTMANIFSNMSQDLLDVCETEDIKVVNLGICPANPGPSNLPFLGDVESVQGETKHLVASLTPAVTCILSDIFLGWTQVSQNFPHSR